MSAFAELHADLREVARSLLGSAAARGAPGDPVVVDRSVLAGAGWLGLEVPEACGGAGATFAETAVVLEELGRSAAVTPMLGSAVLAVGALLLAEPSARRDALLAAVAAGEATATVALPTDDAAVAWLAAGLGPSDAGGVEPPPAGRGEAVPRSAAGTSDGPAVGLPFVLRQREGGGSLFEVSGTATFVPDAPDADVVLLLAAGPDGVPALVALDRPAVSPASTSSAPDAASPAGGVPALVALDRRVGSPASTPSAPDAASPAGAARAGSPAVDGGSPAGAARGARVVTATPVLDGRSFGTVVADGVPVDDGDLLRFAVPAEAVGRIVGRAAIATAVDAVGSAQAMLEATVAYVQDRRQFDRPIGSFQAVKHQLADALVQLTLTRELLAAAIAEPTDRRAAARAKAHATSVAVDVVGTAMQLHGGIGYTWERGVHAHLKRVTLDRSLFGSPAAHRRLLAPRPTAARL